MKNLTTAVTFGAVIAIAAVFVGVYAMNDQITSMSSAKSSAYVLGHVTTIVKDESGNVKSYLQSDNLIVNRGESCALTRLFSNSTVGPVGGCSLPGATANPFNVVVISNYNTTVSDGLQYVSPLSSGATNFNATAGMTPKVAETVVLSAASAGTPAKSVITAIFTNTDASTKTITMAGLQNATHSATNANIGLFSAQNLPTPIALAQNNQLTVEWTINVGGATALQGAVP